MQKQIEEFSTEILQAIEKGVANANETVIKSTKNLDLRALIMHTGEMYAGHIGKAICEIIKKHTEGDYGKQN